MKEKTKELGNSNVLFDFYGKRPEMSQLVPLSLQHVLAAIVGVITPSMIIAGVCGLTDAEKTMMIQAALIFTALATFLQLFPLFHKVGAALPVIMGTSFAYVPTLTAIGGEFGIGMALAIEAWPAKHRAKAASYVALGWQVGVLAAALLTPVLLPHIGWRGMFVVGIFPAFVAWYLRVRLHEPEIFSQKQTELSTQKISKLKSFKLLVKDKATTKVSLGIVVLTSVQNFGYYGIMIWMPNFLSKQLGFSLTKSGLWTAVTVCGMMAGIWIFGRLADRIGRKPSFLLFQLGAVISIITYSQLTDPTAMLVAGAFLGMFVNGMMGGYGALMAEAYPTEARATAQNVLFNLGRAVGGFGPVVVGAIVSAYSFSIAIAFLAVIYVIDMVATVFLVPELKGKELS